MRCLFFLFAYVSLHSYSIVFVHLGPNPPNYLSYSLPQARLFNPEADMYLIGDPRPLPDFLKQVLSENNIQYVPSDSLKQSKSHQVFLKDVQLYGEDGSKKCYWTWTTERVYYLAEFIRAHQLTDVFHLESDVMLYANLKQFLPVFHEHYPNMLGATMESLGRGVLSILYIANAAPIERFADFISYETKPGGTDMGFIGSFMETYRGKFVESLPVLMGEYGEDRPLRSRHAHHAGSDEMYSYQLDQFHSLFDGLALGIFLGGVNLNHAEGVRGPGYVDKQCIFDPTFFSFAWENDEEGRAIPVAMYKEKKWPINNLHIHCKRLELFYSKNILPHPVEIAFWDDEYKNW